MKKISKPASLHPHLKITNLEPIEDESICKYPAGLYIVATPIGNLEDITLRALSTLKNADTIVCEDTRISRKLLNFYGIQKPLIAYHDFNAEKTRPVILEKLKQGETIALITDAGTPLVSDPGYKLVQDILKEGLYFTSVPGPSSVIDALVLSGLPPDRFYFGGFLPVKAGALKNHLESLKSVPATLIFFEAAPRLLPTFKIMKDVFNNRTAVVARELTKKFEQVLRDSLENLIDYYEKNGPPKGEVVLLVEAGKQNEEPLNLDALILSALKNNKSMKDAVASVVKETKLSKKIIYQKALTLSAESKDD
jgi:16S rRNA (cytidine1402-2'-O)-methyltransferase